MVNINFNSLGGTVWSITISVKHLGSLRSTTVVTDARSFVRCFRM